MIEIHYIYDGYNLKLMLNNKLIEYDMIVTQTS